MWSYTIAFFGRFLMKLFFAKYIHQCTQRLGGDTLYQVTFYFTYLTIGRLPQMGIVGAELLEAEWPATASPPGPHSIRTLRGGAMIVSKRRLVTKAINLLTWSYSLRVCKSVSIVTKCLFASCHWRHFHWRHFHCQQNYSVNFASNINNQLLWLYFSCWCSRPNNKRLLSQ